MCGIAGFIAHRIDSPRAALKGNLTQMLSSISQRGPDCFGYEVWIRKHHDTPLELYSSFRTSETQKIPHFISNVSLPDFYVYDMVALFNFRGIPTTENVGTGDRTIQPFYSPNVSVVHNGLLSNDKEMYEKHGWEKICTDHPDIDSYAFCHMFDNGLYSATDLLPEVQGSYAVAALNVKNRFLVLARNFRGMFLQTSHNQQALWFASEAQGVEFGKTPAYELPLNNNLVIPLDQWRSPNSYSWGSISLQLSETIEPQLDEKAIVVLSSGLDSTVCAAWAIKHYKEVHFMHFQYGCRAEKKEEEAFLQIVGWYREKNPEVKITYSIEDLGFIKRLGGSTLTDTTLEVAQGEEGVETDHEWVPARNLVMISLAAAYADRYNFQSIILGLNMEEGSVFSDNSIEFYKRMEAALAIGAKSAPTLVMPLGNLMKRHIWKLGRELEAPLHLSWSCYHGMDLRCGSCGPCIMRKSAAEANGETDDPSLYLSKKV